MISGAVWRDDQRSRRIPRGSSVDYNDIDDDDYEDDYDDNDNCENYDENYNYDYNNDDDDYEDDFDDNDNCENYEITIMMMIMILMTMMVNRW